MSHRQLNFSLIVTGPSSFNFPPCLMERHLGQQQIESCVVHLNYGGLVVLKFTHNEMKFM